MGIDRPDDDDQPAMRRESDHAGSADIARPAVQIETRAREAYYADLRAAVQAERRVASPQTDASQVGRDHDVDEWSTATEQFRQAWTDHQTRWPRPEREHGEATVDSDGRWHADGGRVLDRDANETVDRGCERIREIEATTITPAMRRIEAQDPNRELVGLDHRLKDTDRLKEKVADQLQASTHLSAEQVLLAVPDALRFTFCYGSLNTYTEGVRADLKHLELLGFTKVESRNTWDSDQYKGINSRWREPESGQLFEIQFHTQISFEAKQLTHATYERLRSPQTADTEREELLGLQRQVCAKIPIPPGVSGILDYPSGEAT